MSKLSPSAEMEIEMKKEEADKFSPTDKALVGTVI